MRFKAFICLVAISACSACSSPAKVSDNDQPETTLSLSPSSQTVIQPSAPSPKAKPQIVELPFSDKQDRAYGCVQKHNSTQTQFIRVAEIKAQSALLEKIKPVQIESDFQINQTVNRKNEKEDISQTSTHILKQRVKGDQAGKVLERKHIGEYYCVLVGLTHSE